MYRFTLEPQTRADFEVSNWFTSTHPDSRFRRNLVASRIVGQTRVNLLNALFTVRNAEGHSKQIVLTNADELQHVLQDVMGLELPLPAQAIWAKLPKQSGPT